MNDMNAEVILMQAIAIGTPANVLGDIRLRNGLVVAPWDKLRPCIFCAMRTKSRFILIAPDADIKRADVVCVSCAADLNDEISTGIIFSALVLQAKNRRNGASNDVITVIEYVEQEAKDKLAEAILGAVTPTSFSGVLSDIDNLLAAS